MDTVTNQSDGGFAPPPATQVVTPLAPAPQVVAVGTNAADQTTVISHRQRFNTAGVVCAIAGAAILIMGLVALARADLDGSFNDPVFQVAGWDHTQSLAFIEVFLGIMLLVAGMTSSLSGMRVLGALTVIGAVVALIEPGILGGSLEIEGSHAVALLILGAVTLIAAAALPTIERQSSRVSTHHEADRSNHVA
ncbi:MAG: hypothetical protein ABL953_10220 [Ilumatobacteraceae bacterium]